jgi:hypothetical protein
MNMMAGKQRASALLSNVIVTGEEYSSDNFAFFDVSDTSKMLH